MHTYELIGFGLIWLLFCYTLGNKLWKKKNGKKTSFFN